MLRLVALALCLAVLPAAANEAKIRKVLEEKLEGVRIEGIAPAPIPGLWEVRYRTARGVQLLYTDAAATHVIQGSIHELSTERDLTAERLRKLNAIRFDSLPFKSAVKIRRGSGRRVLAMFSDPYCPACKQFEQTLQQVDDITVYVFMYPVIRPELAAHSKAVWCSADRAKAWLDLALRGRAPGAAAACETPVDDIVELGRGLGVNSTPTLVFVNGERVSGGLRSAVELREVLDQAAAGR
ncbi:MAG: DsbC family protein [Betaproteobacteria bacterium]|nr:DsbC family protein [Betaproteobacteria bacterium]